MLAAAANVYGGFLLPSPLSVSIDCCRMNSFCVSVSRSCFASLARFCVSCACWWFLYVVVSYMLSQIRIPLTFSSVCAYVHFLCAFPCLLCVCVFVIVARFAIRLYVCLSVCMSVCLPVSLSACLSVCLSACASACFFVYGSVWLRACLPVCLSVCLFVGVLQCMCGCVSLC